MPILPRLQDIYDDPYGLYDDPYAVPRFPRQPPASSVPLTLTPGVPPGTVGHIGPGGNVGIQPMPNQELASGTPDPPPLAPPMRDGEIAPVDWDAYNQYLNSLGPLTPTPGMNNNPNWDPKTQTVITPPPGGGNRSPGGGKTLSQTFDYPEFAPPSFDVAPFVPLDPFTYPDYQGPRPFEYEAFAPATPFDYEAYTPAAPFDYPDFAGPTAETFTTDPGYEFRLGEGLRALQNAAAARGILRTGGTLKGLMNYGQNVASQEFGNVYNRQFGEWATGRQAAAEDFDRNEANRLGGWRTNYGRAKDIYDTNEANRLTGWQTNYNRASDTYDRNTENQYRGWLTNYTKGADLYDRNWQNNLTRYMTDYNREADEFNRALTTYGANFGTSSFNAGFNRDTGNQKFGQLLSLYDLTQRNLPKYSPFTPTWGD